MSKKKRKTERGSLAKNQVTIVGRLKDDFEYSHNVWQMKVFKSTVIVKRRSENEDFIPIIATEEVLSCVKPTKGKWIEVSGEFRSHNRMGEDGSTHLDLFLFAKEITIYDFFPDEEEINTNSIFLDGYLCKMPVYRYTPMGKNITDLFLAVNRSFGRSDYIPCIAWGKNATKVIEFKVGDRVRLKGRVQSRKYLKRIRPDSDEGEYREVYEVSVIEIKKVE